jgi:hypothetical protein
VLERFPESVRLQTPISTAIAGAAKPPCIPKTFDHGRNAQMRSQTWSSRSAVLIASLLLPLFFNLAHAQDIDGTWKLVMRKLPDGTTQVPPAVLGAYTGHNGLQNLNVFWHTPDGKPASFSRISTYKMSGTDYTETLLFTGMNDGSGKPTTYNLTGATETTPVTREGGRLAACRT